MYMEAGGARQTRIKVKYSSVLLISIFRKKKRYFIYPPNQLFVLACYTNLA